METNFDINKFPLLQNTNPVCIGFSPCPVSLVQDSYYLWCLTWTRVSNKEQKMCHKPSLSKHNCYFLRLFLRFFLRILVSVQESGICELLNPVPLGELSYYILVFMYSCILYHHPDNNSSNDDLFDKAAWNFLLCFRHFIFSSCKTFWVLYN